MSIAEPPAPQNVTEHVLDQELLHAGQLDAVLVAGRADVAHHQPAQGDVVRRRVVGAAVVDVDAVLARPLDDQVAQLQVGDVGEVQRLAAALEDRLVGRVGRRDDDRPAGLAAGRC